MQRVWTPPSKGGIPVTWHCTECEVEWSGSRGCWFCARPGIEGRLPVQETGVRAPVAAQHAYGGG